jgi:hypothetical protein
MAPPPIAHRMRFYTDDELHGLLQRAGYAEITVRRTAMHMRPIATDAFRKPADLPEHRRAVFASTGCLAYSGR